MSDSSALLRQIPGILHGFGDKRALLPAGLQPYEATRPVKNRCMASGLWMSPGQSKPVVKLMGFSRPHPAFF